MKKRISTGEEITSCNQCPFYGWFTDHGRCGGDGSGRDIEGKNPSIPDWCPIEEPLPKIPQKVVDALNELSKPDVFFIDSDVRKIAWAGVGRLKDAESILMEMLVDQETLAVGIRNEALIEKAKKYFGITD